MCKCENQTNCDREAGLPLGSYKVLVDRLDRMCTGMEKLGKVLSTCFSNQVPLTRVEVSDILKISHGTLDKILHSGNLPFSRINGKHIRIMPDHLMDYIKSNQI